MNIGWWFLTLCFNKMSLFKDVISEVPYIIISAYTAPYTRQQSKPLHHFAMLFQLCLFQGTLWFLNYIGGGFAHHIWSLSWYFTIKLLLDSPFEPSKTSQRQSLQKTGKIRWEYKKFSANLSLLSHIKKTGTNFVTKFHKIQCMWQTVWIT